MKADRLLYLLAGAGVVFAAWLGGCDGTLPDDPNPLLVVEGFIETGKPLPAIRIRRAVSVAAAYDSEAAAASGAEIVVRIGARSISYVPDAARAGLYRPAEGNLVTALPGDLVTLDLTWQGRSASGAGIVPPAIEILSTAFRIPDEPVSAVLLDSLALSDSLSVDARQGFIYPIEVSLTWRDTGPTSRDFWVRAQLQPYATFSSSVVDLFLRSEEILEEESAPFAESGIRSWTGVYAVGVNDEDEPVPEHTLRVALIRSSQDYARFAATRRAPERREPISNLEGAIGIFTAISVDSTRIRLGGPAGAGSAAMPLRKDAMP